MKKIKAFFWEAYQMGVIPLLIFLYVLPIGPYLVRQLSHLMLIWLDNAFDRVAKSAGYKPGGWPLPRSQECELPGRRIAFKDPQGFREPLS